MQIKKFIKQGLTYGIAVGAVAVIAGLIINRPMPVSASAGYNSSCTSCHSDSGIKVSVDSATKTVSAGGQFPVGLTWSGGGTSKNEVNWPNAVSNTLFTPTPRIPYSGSNASGSTSSTLTAPTTPGTYTVRVFAAMASPSMASDFKDVTVTVTGVTNSPPVLSAIGAKSIAEGQLLTFAVSATDPDGDALTYSASNLPSGATFNATTRTFSWTPTFTQAGSYPLVHFTVTDGSLTASQDITITVVNVNRSPVLAAIGNKSTAEGTLLTFAVSATDPDGDALTYSASNLPTGATFNATTRTFSWTPTFTQAGSYTLVHFAVTDGSLTASEDITITVVNVNRAPVLTTIGSKTTTEGQLLTFTVSGSDPDGDALTYSASNLPTGATFNATTRTFSWTPAAGQAGSYPLVHFAVTDGSLTASEDITIAVTAVTVNHAPVLAVIGGKTVNEGQPLTFAVSATDPDGNALTYSASNLPSGVTFNATTRTFSWTPTFTQAGSYTLVHFAVTDGSLTASEDITITVVNVNRAPVLTTIGSKTTTEGQLLTFTVSGRDPDGDILTYSASNMPTGATFDGATRVFTWTPATGQAGSYPLVHFAVTDGSLTASEDIIVTVTVVSAAPVDKTGPLASRLSLIRNYSRRGYTYTLTARISDAATGNSTIAAAEYFIDTPGAAGTGIAMSPAQGSFDSVTETVKATLSLSSMDDGRCRIYVRCKDSAGNWGQLVSVRFRISNQHETDIHDDGHDD